MKSRKENDKNTTGNFKPSRRRGRESSHQRRGKSTHCEWESSYPLAKHHHASSRSRIRYLTKNAIHVTNTGTRYPKQGSPTHPQLKAWSEQRINKTKTILVSLHPDYLRSFTVLPFHLIPPCSRLERSRVPCQGFYRYVPHGSKGPRWGIHHTSRSEG